MFVYVSEVFNAKLVGAAEVNVLKHTICTSDFQLLHGIVSFNLWNTHLITETTKQQALVFVMLLSVL